MAVRTISLNEDAYRLLRAAKRPGESFSEVVERILAKERPKVADLAGLLEGETGNRLKAVVTRLRREDAELARDRAPPRDEG